MSPCSAADDAPDGARRVLLRAATQRDHGWLEALIHEPEVAALFNTAPPGAAGPGRRRFIALDCGSGDPVGMVALQGSCLSYCVPPPLWGRGYGSGMVRMVIASLAPALGLEWLDACVLRHNARSCRVLENLGFQFAGLTTREWGALRVPMAALRYRRRIDAAH